jgi:hypothetical protein
LARAAPGAEAAGVVKAALVALAASVDSAGGLVRAAAGLGMEVAPGAKEAMAARDTPHPQW